MSKHRGVLLLAFIFGQSASVAWAEDRDAIVFGRGVFSSTREALKNDVPALRSKLRNQLGITDEELDRRFTFHLATNTTRCNTQYSCLGDVFEAAVQWTALNEPNEEDRGIWRRIWSLTPAASLANELVRVVSSFQPLNITAADVAEQVDLYEKLIGDDHMRVVLIAHSQGNYFGNLAYRELSSAYKTSFGMYSVATPASDVLGRAEPYYTEFLDFIHLVPNSLPSNTSSGECSNPWSCHFFAGSYMEGLSGAIIVNEVLDLLDSLPRPQVLPLGFTRISDMTSPRTFHCAVRLTDGRVLVAGGFAPNRTPLNTAELYDPSTRTFSQTGAMTARRGRGLSCALLENGKVLVAGGEVTPFVYTSSAELYDPATSTFSPVGNMTTPRGEGWHAFAVPGGALLFGGTFEGGLGTATGAVDRFSTSSNSFSRVGTLLGARRDYTAEALPDNSVLLIGGVRRFDQQNFPIIERYLISGNQSVLTGQPSGRSRTRTWGSALLPGGNVFVVTGIGLPAEIYDSETDSFALVSGSPSFYAGDFGRALPLLDGRALLLGYGRAPGEGGRIAEVFDAASGAFSTVGPFAIPGPCEGYAATLLQDGTVLVTGGGTPPSCDSEPLAEIFNPAGL